MALIAARYGVIAAAIRCARIRRIVAKQPRTRASKERGWKIGLAASSGALAARRENRETLLLERRTRGG